MMNFKKWLEALEPSDNPSWGDPLYLHTSRDEIDSKKALGEYINSALPHLKKSLHHLHALTGGWTGLEPRYDDFLMNCFQYVSAWSSVGYALINGERQHGLSKLMIFLNAITKNATLMKNHEDKDMSPSEERSLDKNLEKIIYLAWTMLNTIEHMAKDKGLWKNFKMPKYKLTHDY